MSSIIVNRSQSKENIKSYKFVVSIFFIMVFLRDVIGVSIPLIAFTAVWMFVIFAFDIEKATAFTVSSTICFASSISITIPIAVFIVMAVLKLNIKIHGGFLTCIILILFIEMLKFTDKTQNFKLYINMAMVVLLLFIVVTIYLNNTFTPDFLLKNYVVFFLFLASDILISTIISYGSFSAILSDNFRIGQTNLLDTYTGDSLAMSINANGLAFLAIVAIALTLVLVNYRKVSKKFAFPTIIYCSLIGLLTISKTFALIFITLIGMYYLWYVFSSSKKVSSVIGLIALLIVLISIFLRTTIFENLMERFESGDLTTGRLDLIEQYIRYMEEHPNKILFGLGLQDVHKKAGFETVPHNAILETYVCMGLVGLIVTVFLFVNLFKLCKGKYLALYGKKPLNINYIPFLIYILFIQTFQFFRINYIIAPLILVSVCIFVGQGNSRINRKR